MIDPFSLASKPCRVVAAKDIFKLESEQEIEQIFMLEIVFENKTYSLIL